MQRNVPNIKKSLGRLEYEIPERYSNAFYLANAAFFDSTNWFLHRAYEVGFPSLKNSCRLILKDSAVGDTKIHEKLINIVQSLDQCNSIIDVRFPVRRENGMLEVIRGFRAHYGQAVRNSPCLGGLRIHQDVTRDHMKALSVLSAVKSSCLGTGLSGAMGGIKINPKAYSERELRTIIELYARELQRKGYCSHRDIVHPDINTSEKEMKWIADAFSKGSGQSINAACTGKPVEDGGVEGYEKATALGAFKSLQIILDNNEIMLKTGCVLTGIKNKSFIIQGLGKVGKPLALMLVEAGAICVGVKEKEAYLYDAKGIDLNALYKHREERGTIENFGLSKTEYPDTIFTEDCDILILAAGQKSLVCYIARDVKARVILEAADGPVTPTAHRILTTKSKLVVPDIYACGGATVMSYFEYLRNLQQIGLSSKDLLRYSTEIYSNIFKNMARGQQRMVNSSQIQNISVYTPLAYNFAQNSIDLVYSEVGQEILKTAESYNLGVDLRTAAYVVAIKNMFKTIFEEKTLT